MENYHRARCHGANDRQALLATSHQLGHNRIDVTRQSYVPRWNGKKGLEMVMIDKVRPLTLDGQYIAMGNIETIRFVLLDLFHKQSVIRRLKSYPNSINPEDELNHIQLLDPVWLEFCKREYIDLDGKQTLVRFYEPGLIKLRNGDRGKVF